MFSVGSLVASVIKGRNWYRCRVYSREFVAQRYFITPDKDAICGFMNSQISSYVGLLVDNSGVRKYIVDPVFGSYSDMSNFAIGNLRFSFIQRESSIKIECCSNVGDSEDVAFLMSSEVRKPSVSENMNEVIRHMVHSYSTMYFE